MKLYQHPDFDQAILEAARHFADRGLRPGVIEKDYYVTEALRRIHEAAGAHVIFKGGTSLSKGWNLLDRFSEDIDLFLDPASFVPPLGRNAINREAKAIRDAVDAHPGLNFVPDQSQTIGGFGRSDRFRYAQRFGGVGEVAGTVLLETGAASGRQPTEVRVLRSLLAAFLSNTGQSLGAEDESAFSMRLLHFRRTFVEKLFAIHSKVELLVRDGQPLASYARHYYDLYQLAAQPEVLAMLESPEHAEIKMDYDEVSRKYFPASHFPPQGMSFSNSAALFPPAELESVIQTEYEAQCRLLCFLPPPTWTEVRARFDELRALL